MKRTTAFILTLLLVFSTALAAFPIGIFAASGAQEITESVDGYTGTIGYGGYIVRTKSDGSIMLSPFLSQLRADVDGGADINDYTAEMTFTLLTGANGSSVHTFDTVYAAINKSNGQYFDIYLNGTKGVTGFCPIAGAFYAIELNIYKNYGESGQELVYFGTYNSAEIPAGISSSKYYDPTPAPVTGQQITETKDDYTGSIGYNGGIRVKSDKSIMFSPYITELKALCDSGASASDYEARLTFMLLTGKDGTVEHTFDTVTVSLTKSNSYFDIFLNGTKGDSGFCPTAGCYYNIEVEIYKKADGAVAMYGTYKNALAPEGISESAYYKPTPKYIQISETVDGYTSSKWYSDGIRKNSSGLIMFSPFITELRNDVDKGVDPSTYNIVADFTLLDDEGNKVHTFEDISIKPNKSSNGKYFDIPLQSSSVDCGFCPTAGSKYNIYIEIYDNSGALKYYGEYKGITAGTAIAQSSYYAPTAVPGAPVDYNITISYSFNNIIEGSAAGKIFVTTDKPGYFSIGWGDGEGNPLTVTTGEKTIAYSELSSFAIIEGAGGSYVENVNAFAAIPVGAKTIIITDSADNVLEALALPEDKLLEEEAPEYTFGVVSDVHFNYFFNSDKTIDYAEGAFDNALNFYKSAGVKLVTAAGDYSLYAEEESYKEFYEAVAKSGLLVLACGGNHELYASLDVMFGENGYWRTYMNTGVYDGTVEGVLDIADNGIDFTYQIPGVEDAVFVSLSQWYWDGHTASQKKLVEPEQLEWLEEQFELHKDKTVYFLFHTYLSDDDGENVDGQGDLKNPGGYSYNGHYNTYTSDEKVFRWLLTKYDNVVWYNGHSHYEFSMQMFNENLNIFDYEGTTGTMIHVPSVTNPRTVGVNSTSYSSLYGEASQGVLQFVYDDYDIVNGIDFMGEEILSYACYIVYKDKTDIVEEGTIEGTEITWTYDAQLNSLRILGNGEIPSYTNAAAPWAKYAENIYSVYVGNGIKVIGDNAFNGFTKVIKVELKDVTKIGAGAFAGTGLQTLILPEILTNIANGAFDGVTNIKDIIFGGTAEKWDDISIGSGNDGLDADKNYKKVVVTFVAGDETTTQDVKVGTVPSYGKIPQKEHENPDKHYLFTGWTDGTNKYGVDATLPVATANVTYTALFESEVDRYVSGTINDGAIIWTVDRITGTLVISGTGEMPNFTVDGDNDTRPYAEYATTVTKVIVKGGITKTGARAFQGFKAMTELVLEEGVKIIAQDLASNCPALTTMTIPGTVTSIGQGIVYNTPNVATVNYGGESEDAFRALASVNAYNDNFNNATVIIYVPEKPTVEEIKVSPYAPDSLKGFENWSEQTQLLICTTKEVPLDATWVLKISDGITVKVITVKATTGYDTWLRRFEICCYEGENQFIPVKGTEYTISAEIYDVAGNMIFTAPAAEGFVCELDPIVPQPEPEGPKEITVQPYSNGWENWSGQTQLLIIAPFDSSIAGSTGFTWEITLGGKTITLVPSSWYDFGNGNTIWRFETCLGEGENQFIPEAGASYVITAKVYNGEELVYIVTAAAGMTWDVPADFVPIVPETEEPKVGFVTEEDGTRYYYEDGSFATGWATIDGKTYRFDPETGVLFTGSVLNGVNDYYFNADHSTVEGFVTEDGGIRFYKKGVRQYGWVDTDFDGTADSYFYTVSKLRCEEDRVLFDGKDTRRFYMYNAETGFMEVVNGFYTDENGTQYFRNGLGAYGWITPEGESITDRPGITVSGAYYFAYGDGINFYMVEESEKTIGGVVRVFGEDNLVEGYTGWKVNTVTGRYNYYLNGEMQFGWVETAEGWVYLSRSEKIEEGIGYGDAVNGWVKIGGKVYYFQVAESIPAFVVVTNPERALKYGAYRDIYTINQTPENGESMVGSDYYITNPPADF